MFKRKRNLYLKPNRLADVLALLQVLALDKNAHRSEKGLLNDLKVKPKSSTTWQEVAQEHPEFFRVSDDDQFNISLISRHAIPSKGKIKEIPDGFLAVLFETAIQLHDKQMRRFEAWKIWTPIIAVIISGGISLFVAFYNNGGPKINNESIENEKIKNDTTTSCIFHRGFRDLHASLLLPNLSATVDRKALRKSPT